MATPVDVLASAGESRVRNSSTASSNLSCIKMKYRTYTYNNPYKNEQRVLLHQLAAQG